MYLVVNSAKQIQAFYLMVLAWHECKIEVKIFPQDCKENYLVSICGMTEIFLTKVLYFVLFYKFYA